MRRSHLAPCFNVHIPTRRDSPTCVTSPTLTISNHWIPLTPPSQAELLESAPALRAAAKAAEKAKLEALERQLGINAAESASTEAGPSSGSGSKRIAEVDLEELAKKKHKFEDSKFLEESREINDNVRSAVSAGESGFNLVFKSSAYQSCHLLAKPETRTDRRSYAPEEEEEGKGRRRQRLLEQVRSRRRRRQESREGQGRHAASCRQRGCIGCARCVSKARCSALVYIFSPVRVQIGSEALLPHRSCIMLYADLNPVVLGRAMSTYSRMSSTVLAARNIHLPAIRVARELVRYTARQLDDYHGGVVFFYALVMPTLAEACKMCVR
jgi:hypothetical protein